MTALKVFPFFGWRVVWAAFTVALFGWGIGFYGPPIFLNAIHKARGWPVSLVSAAITCHFLFGALVVANLTALHQRFGLVVVTRAGGFATALGFLGWALAREPWQLFAATTLSGPGWAATGAAAINAMISPWFVRRRPAALSSAYNGASLGGVIFSPLWAALIGALGFAYATAITGFAMVMALWWLSERYFAYAPAAMGLLPDGDTPTMQAPSRAGASMPPLPGVVLWRSCHFVTLTVATSIGLFAQIGLIAHLFSLLVPALGAHLAGFMAGLAAAFAIAGRTGLGWLLPARANRRRVAAANYSVQACGALALLLANGTNVPLLLLGVVLFGGGIGNTTSLPPLIAQTDFPPADTARVVALVTACSQACYAFAPALFGALRDISASSGASGGHAPLLFAVAACAQITAAGIILISRRSAMKARLACERDIRS